MNLWVSIQLALRALGKNKTRAALTILGMFIGVAAVIMMVAIGQGAGEMIQGEFQRLGTNVILVFPGAQETANGQRGSRTAPSLTSDDADAIIAECPAALAASPYVSARAQVVYGNVNWSPDEVVGVSESYLTVRNWAMRRGGFFTENEVRNAEKVCVLGRTLVGKLFQTTDPIGRTVRVANIPFEVIGVLESKGANLVGQDQDNILLIPYTTAMLRLRGTTFRNVDTILISARSVARMPEAEEQIKLLLRQRHRVPTGGKDDFEVANTSEMAKAFGVVTNVMTLMLAAIAGVSLVVGGVGIMNIMLVSVTERTREIGIRMAIGARSRDILRQFLVEAFMLSTLGGILGVLLGVGASVAIAWGINEFSSIEWPTVVSPWSIVLALVFAGAVGMFFGYYPARKASLLDPIESLRYE